jgi:predicted outer membrane repeat protein
LKPYAAIAGCAILVVASFATAATIRVDLSGSGDYTTIQQGLDAAAGQDTVLVAAGTYTGALNRELDFHGKAIVLTSEAGSGSTIIDCQNAGRGFYFHAGEFWWTVVEGFTVTNGSAYEGGAVWCEISSPAIFDCVFSDNSANFGGAMHLGVGSAPDIEGCVFLDNTATEYGGAIYAYQSQPYVLECEFTGNEAGINGGAISCKAASSTRILYCTYEDNTAADGGAIYVGMLGAPGGEAFIPTIISFSTFSDNSATRGGALFSNSFAVTAVSFCTFTRNSANEGGAIYTLTDYDGFFNLQNSTLVWNDANYGGGICCAGVPDYNQTTVTTSIIAFSEEGTALYRQDYTPVTTNFNIVYENAGGNYMEGPSNIVADPLFCDALGGDYNLCENSPCRGANNEWGFLIGSHRQICGPCESPVERKTWGSIKGMYR